jgi:hypothetical protein
VLHWSRSSVETFVVQDEGTTFRYRSGSNSAAVTTGIADENIPAAPVARIAMSATGASARTQVALGEGEPFDQRTPAD